MKHLFIPYNLAVLAKDRGFAESCFAGYWPNESVIYPDGPDRISAPLYQQIIDWFREKHGLCISIIGSNPFYPIIFNSRIDGNSERELDECYSYYEALDQAIEEAFKLI